MEYSISTGSRLYERELEEPSMDWNPKTKRFTDSKQPAFQAESYGFIFESPGRPAFIVIIFETSAIIRKATQLLKSGKWEFGDFEINCSQLDGREDNVLISHGGQEFGIFVSVTVKKVYHWLVYEVDVDMKQPGVDWSFL